MKLSALIVLTLTAATPLCLAQVVPGQPQNNGLTPRTGTFEVNHTNINNTATESTGVSIAANGNVLIGWEDDGNGITDFEAVWTLFDGNGNLLTPMTMITNYDGSQNVTTYYRAFFRSDGSPMSGYAAWGPKIKANRFGDGLGMGATAYGFDIDSPNPELKAMQTDAATGTNNVGDFPAVQLLDNDGNPLGIVSGTADADAEPAGDIRIGDWEHLANGNIVIVGESRQAADWALTGQTSGNVPVYRIVTAAGVQVKGYTAVSSQPVAGSIWHGVGVTANGFAVRFDAGGATVRMFDNDGNPTTGNINLATLTGHPEVAQGGRGDGTGFHGNGIDAYVHVNTGGGTPWMTVLNASGTLRWSRKVAEDHETIGSDRLDGAISPDGRVIAVWDDPNASPAGLRLPQARMFSPSGVPVGNRFWVSERDQPVPGGTATAATRRPRIAWRDNCVAVIWETLNSPDTFNRVVAARLFNLPSLPVITSIVDDGGTVVIRWTGGGPTYTVYRRTSLTEAPGTVATGITDKVHSEFKDFQQAFYHISSP